MEEILFDIRIYSIGIIVFKFIWFIIRNLPKFRVRRRQKAIPINKPRLMSQKFYRPLPVNLPRQLSSLTRIRLIISLPFPIPIVLPISHLLQVLVFKFVFISGFSQILDLFLSAFELISQEFVLFCQKDQLLDRIRSLFLSIQGRFQTGRGRTLGFSNQHALTQLLKTIIISPLIKMIEAHQPLIEIFGDVNYAWQLLEGEVKLETADNVTGEDIAHLLQLYMRGVEKMNSMIDFRESFFKNRVTTLMSRPTVIKSLNKPMSKKTHQAPVVESIPVKKVDNRAQLQLQQKKRQMQMRIAYGAEEHNPDALKKMLNEHTQKQYIITKKIHNIVNEHDERLMKRIKERKLKTMTLKSRSDMYMNNDTTESSGLDGQDRRERKEMIERKRDQEQFGGSGHENGAKENGTVKKEKTIRKIKSLEPKRTRFKDEPDSPVKRRVSIDFVDKRKV